MAINHLHSSSDATSLYLTITSGTLIMFSLFWPLNLLRRVLKGLSHEIEMNYKWYN
jgi:hypothetical protein